MPAQEFFTSVLPDTMQYCALSKSHNLSSPFWQILMNQMSLTTISITCAHCSLTGIVSSDTVSKGKETYPPNTHTKQDKQACVMSRWKFNPIWDVEGQSSTNKENSINSVKRQWNTNGGFMERNPLVKTELNVVYTTSNIVWEYVLWSKFINKCRSNTPVIYRCPLLFKQDRIFWENPSLRNPINPNLFL